jgi:hypothetical protein
VPRGAVDPPQPKKSAAVSSKAASPSQARRGAFERRRSAPAKVARLRRNSSHGNATRRLGESGGVGQRGGAIERPAVVTVTIAFIGVVPLSGSEFGETLQLDWGAEDTQESDTVPLNPAVPATLTV